jgi:Na+/phosphate symporter
LVDESGIVETSTTEVRESIKSLLNIYDKTIKAIKDEDRRLLRKNALKSEEIYKKYKDKRTFEVVPTIQTITLKELDIEQEYVQIVDYTYEITKALRVITADSLIYIQNNHKGFNDEQEADLEELSNHVAKLYETFMKKLDESDYSKFSVISELRDEILEKCADLTKKQIKRVKRQECGTRNSILFMTILNETKNIALQSTNLMKSQRNMYKTVKRNAERIPPKEVATVS